MIRVRVPATSANMGPGFDCLGVAVKLYNEIEIEETETGIEIIQTGTYKKNIPPKDNLAYKAMCEVFEKTGKRPSGLRIKINTSVPATRGLGSSAACIIGGLVGANAIYGMLGPKEILSIASKMEGHPDNVVPCLTGGMAAAYFDGENVTYAKFNMPPELKFLVLYPENPLETKKSRGVIPDEVPHKDAAFNAAHTALIVAAIAKKDFSLLNEAMADKLHQPYRKKIVGHMEPIFDFYRSVGAYSWYLSGSGPSVAAIIPASKEEKIKNEAALWAEENGFLYEVMDFENSGTHVIKF